MKRTKKICRECDKPSVPGLMKHIGLCQYHYNKFMFGEAWANEVLNKHTEQPIKKEVANMIRR